jgi:integrase/recombinase XerD
MRVQRLVMPDGAESWTVLDHRGDVVAPAEAFLAHLQALNRSPTTVRTYAISLKLWWEFLDGAGCEFDVASVDHMARFVAWLRAPAENVTVLAGGEACCSAVSSADAVDCRYAADVPSASEFVHRFPVLIPNYLDG